MPLIATTLAPGLKMVLTLADVLAKDIPASEFARMPAGVKMNSPAFNYGHLSIYPERAFDMIGRSDLARHDAKWTELFSSGKECLDDPTGSVYPPMGELVERFRTRHQLLLQILPDVSDDVMMGTNPMERLRDRLPTVGAAMAFLVSAHPMGHLGQVSAWRRIKGLGSAVR